MRQWNRRSTQFHRPIPSLPGDYYRFPPCLFHPAQLLITTAVSNNSSRHIWAPQHPPPLSYLSYHTHCLGGWVMFSVYVFMHVLYYWYSDHSHNLCLSDDDAYYSMCSGPYCGVPPYMCLLWLMSSRGLTLLNPSPDSEDNKLSASLPPWTWQEGFLYRPILLSDFLPALATTAVDTLWDTGTQ